MIQVSHLSKMYGPRPAISDLCFSVERGEIIGFLGPNGAGKSTTMKILSGFMPATSGSVSVAGFDVFEKPLEVKRRVGFLPENPPIYNEMSVDQYLRFVAKIKGVAGGKIGSQVQETMAKTGLTDVRKRLIGNLSKGYRQRVGLAQALVHNPEVLILDEPTVGLDPNQIIEIRNVIKGLKGQHTVILSSHILPEVTATCDRIIVINRGTIVAQDTLEQLTRRLRKGQIFTMTIREPKSSLVQTLKSIRGVAEVTTDPRDGRQLHIEIRADVGEVRDQVVAAAVQAGAGVLEFASEKLSLEEIFLQLTTHETTQETRH